MFSQQDIQQINSHGVSLEDVENQMTLFQSGFPEIQVTEPCTIGKGIFKFSSSEENGFADYFDREAKSYRCLKFVPASGAATRMFKHLYTHLHNPESLSDKEKKWVQEFEFGIENFAFYCHAELRKIIDSKGFTSRIEAVLSEKGLNYGNMPKALLKFHAYPEGKTATPIEEHFFEGHQHLPQDFASIHFTVSEQHISKIQEYCDELTTWYKNNKNITIYVSISVQNKSTDTLAVNENNEPFRDDNGNLIFRPSGHGALLENLNNIDADIVFIKNIDNVLKN